MRIDILTIFPELFAPFFATSLIGQARAAGVIAAHVHDIRQFATDAHRTVDDAPYGGGPGMILKIAPIDKALEAVTQIPPNPPLSRGALSPAEKTSRVVVLSARGEQFTQAKAEEYARLDRLIFICGRYEGIDQRVADHLADEELSIGPYVLAGGEAAALVVVEAVARLVPGVIGNPESLKEESFHGSLPLKRGGGQEGVDQFNTPPPPSPHLRGGKQGAGAAEYPQYTKPAAYKGWKVPEVLLSGNHEAIRRWRAAQRQSL